MKVETYNRYSAFLFGLFQTAEDTGPWMLVAQTWVSLVDSLFHTLAFLLAHPLCRLLLPPLSQPIRLLSFRLSLHLPSNRICKKRKKIKSNVRIPAWIANTQKSGTRTSPWTSSGASRLASLTVTGAISSIAMDGILLTILTSGAGCRKETRWYFSYFWPIDAWTELN